jgi:hypothetical protein
MEPVINRNPEWLFAEPAPRARRRAVILRAACWVSVVVVLIALVLAFRGSILGVLIVFVGTAVATAAGVEAYWAAEIARRARESRGLSTTPPP